MKGVTPQTTFLSGVQTGLPVMLGVVPFGLVAGVSAVSVGLPELPAVLLSAIVFAGASQLAGLQLIASGSPVLVILMTTFFINLRFVMYSASIAPYLERFSALWKGLMAYLMTDQAYAFALNRFSDEPEMPHKNLFYIGIAAPIWCVWMISTVVGVFVGAQVPEGWSLEFAIPLIFMVLIIPAVTDRASAAAAFAAGVTVIVADPLPFNLALIVAALMGIGVGVLVETANMTRAESS